MKGHYARRWKQVVVAGAMTALVAGMGSTPPSAYAGGTIKADDDKWISIGMGIRTSFNAQEGASPAGHYSNEFTIPHEVGVEWFQPYVRFTSIDPLYSALRQEFEYGVNYIISGHNARISAFGRYGDLETKGFFNNFGPNTTGNEVDSFHVALQLQY